MIYPTAIGWDPRDDQDEKARQLDAWTTVQRGHAIANGLPLLSVNRIGFEAAPDGGPGSQFWGGSFAAGPQGELLIEAPNDEDKVMVVEIDYNASEEVRRIWPFLRDRRIDAFDGLIKRFLN